MPRLAIVITAVGNIESLESTLVSVLENRPADSEIIVALRQPYADPYDLKDEVRFIAPARRSKPTAALNAALAATRAPFVHTLASGCTVFDGWTDAALARFGDRRLASVVPLVTHAERSDKVFAAGVGYRTRGQRYLVGHGAAATAFEPAAATLGPAHFAGFYRKGALDLVGGFSQSLGLCQADVDVALALRQAGMTTAIEPRCQILASDQVEQRENAWADARAEERLYRRQIAGAMVGHLFVAGWDVLRAFPRPQAAARMLGRLWGALETGAHARHRHQLAALAAHAVSPVTDDPNTRIDNSHSAPARRELAPARVRSR